MNAKPADDTAPADEAPPWLYRSEGFAEDLDDTPEGEDEPTQHKAGNSAA